MKTHFTFDHGSFSMDARARGGAWWSLRIVSAVPYLYGAPFIFIELQVTFKMTLTPFQADLCNHELVSVFLSDNTICKNLPQKKMLLLWVATKWNSKKKKKRRSLCILFLLFPSVFFSPFASGLKSPLGEPQLCCQATRLSESRALMNRLSVMAVALPTHLTQTQTGGRTYARVQTVWHVCSLSCQDANTLSKHMVQDLVHCTFYSIFIYTMISALVPVVWRLAWN